MVRFTREQLLFYLKRRAKELGRTPLGKDMVAPSPSRSTYMSRFGTWNSALEQAGLPVRRRSEYSKDALIENLRMLAKELGRQPKPGDLNGRRWAGSYATYAKRFGSWPAAVKAAGVAASAASLKGFLK